MLAAIVKMGKGVLGSFSMFLGCHWYNLAGIKELKELLDDIGWTENDMKRLKLIK
jgi:hypothetical protein